MIFQVGIKSAKRRKNQKGNRRMIKICPEVFTALVFVVFCHSISWSASSKVGGSVVNNVRSVGLEVVHHNRWTGGTTGLQEGSGHATAGAIGLSGSEVQRSVLNDIRVQQVSVSSLGSDNTAAVGAVVLEHGTVGGNLVNRIHAGSLHARQIGQNNRLVAGAVVVENSTVNGNISNDLDAGTVSVSASGDANQSIAGSIALYNSEVENSVDNHVRAGALTVTTDGHNNQAHAAAIVVENGSARSISNSVEADTVSAMATGDSSIANAASVNLFHATVGGEIINHVTAGEIIAEARNGGRVDLGSVDIRNSVVDGTIYNLSQDSMQGSADGGIVTVNSVIEE